MSQDLVRFRRWIPTLPERVRGCADCTKALLNLVERERGLPIVPRRALMGAGAMAFRRPRGPAEGREECSVFDFEPWKTVFGASRNGDARENGPASLIGEESAGAVR
jgi:hypothetical protein